MNQNAVQKKKEEGLSKVTELAKNVQVTKKPTQPEAKEPQNQDEGPPFGGGTLVGLIINPSPETVQKAQGYDEFGFSHSRSYGGSIYKPLQDYCSKLLESDSEVDRRIGREHLGDRFMVKRPNEPAYSEAEEAMYAQAHKAGVALFESGAVGPIVFPQVSVLTHAGMRPHPGHYIPSCGEEEELILDEFIDYMEVPERWLYRSRLKLLKGIN